MITLLNTAGVHPRDSFQFWQDVIFQRIVPVELTRFGEKPFEGKLEGANFGPLAMTRVTQSAIRTEATPNTVRRHDKHEMVSIVLMLSGILASAHEGRESIQKAGEFVVLDRKPTVMLTQNDSCSIVLEIPRVRLERMLGPVSQYAGLTVGAEQTISPIVSNFLIDLTRIEKEVDYDLATRLSSVGIDLIIAGLSERMAREAPRALASTLLLQRAKAYVESNLGDPTLDPPQLAIAMGVSLRRLQQVFKEENEGIADWIWRRRLELAAALLAEPQSLHVSIGEMAYACGFISQSHFSRRFKDRYGLPPAQFRISIMSATPDHASNHRIFHLKGHRYLSLNKDNK